MMYDADIVKMNGLLSELSNNMEDRDDKKTFTIPKTHKANKDVIIGEKLDSRNVTELFEDIRSCALEVQFDFRAHGCQSCDTIRNQKLQKSYNEKRLRMRREQDPVERLAFHLVTYRPVAITLANDGIRCEQLSFPIDKSLGNSKDGVHLSKRPDVLLSSSGAQGLYRFGLVVCKVLLGKGYATIPSSTNNQLSAQVNYDHHFCKIQSISKEQQHIDDLLANSLIFCYEHENFEPVPHPPQILPIAILWYDLTDKFAPGLISASTLDSQHRNGKAKVTRTLTNTNAPKLLAKRMTSSPSKPPRPSKSGTWDEPVPKTNAAGQASSSNLKESSSKKYPNHLIIPYHRAHSTPLFVSTTIDELPNAPTPVTPNFRDPRLLRTKRELAPPSSEIGPSSPRQLLHERSLSDSSSSSKLSRASPDGLPFIAKISSAIYIPLNASSHLTDPRSKTRKTTRTIFYLESQAAKHALQQQKRLNHYHDVKSGLPPKTSYTIIPYVAREVSSEEYERLFNTPNNHPPRSKRSDGASYPSLYVAVADCFNFGFVKPVAANAMYIDLDQSENQFAYEQIEVSNALIQREKQLNSQQIRLRLREKRHRRMQQQLNEKRNHDRLDSKGSPDDSSSSYITAGRQLLRERESTGPSTNAHMSADLLDFFSHEYKTESRTHVKQLLAELMGIFSEKYLVSSDSVQKNSTLDSERNKHSAHEPLLNSQGARSVVDMELDPSTSQGLCDRDERFRVPSPQPPPLPPLSPLPALENGTPCAQPMLSITLIPTLPSEPNKVFDDPDYNERCHQLIDQLEQCRQKQTKSEALMPTEEDVLKACVQPPTPTDNNPVGESRLLAATIEAPDTDNIFLPLIPVPTASVDEDVNRSRDEFVKLLTKEAFISKSASPVNDESKHRRSGQYQYERGRSHDHNDSDISSAHHTNLPRSHSRPMDLKPRSVSPVQRKVSSTRTVTLVSKRAALSDEIENHVQQVEATTSALSDLHDEPAAKRAKRDSISLSSRPVDAMEKPGRAASISTRPLSIVSVPTFDDDQDHRHALEEKRRTVSKTSSVTTTSDYGKSRSSRSHSGSESKERHQHHQRSSTGSRNSSAKNSTPASESDRQSQHKSTKDEQRSERRRSSDRVSSHQSQFSNRSHGANEPFSRIPQRNSLPTVYKQRKETVSGSSNNTYSSSQRPTAGHKRFNYNHQSVSDHPRFAKTSASPSSTPLADINYSKSPTRHCNTLLGAAADRNVHSTSDCAKSIDQNELRQTSQTTFLDSRPSSTIKSLQILLQKAATDSLERSQPDRSVNDTVTDTSSPMVHSSQTAANSSVTQIHSPICTDIDSEKLINMLQRARKQ